MAKSSFYSPLRYPGGKNKLSRFISAICEQNEIDGHYVEPYAGGAAVALHLLLTNKVKHITINDFDVAIFAFWHSVLYETDKLCSLIEEHPINLSTWKRCRKVLATKHDDSNLLELGYSTLFLNRTNYSGVLNAGVIGGKEQKGKYKIDCRFNRMEIIKKIRVIAERKSDITLENLDALELIKKVRKDRNTLFYFDPPYYLKGPSLYLNYYKHEDHQKVSREIQKIKRARWIVSYDDTPQISELYENLPTIRYSFSHTVNKAREGLESIFVDPHLKIDLKKHPIVEYR